MSANDFPGACFAINSCGVGTDFFPRSRPTRLATRAVKAWGRRRASLALYINMAGPRCFVLVQDRTSDHATCNRRYCRATSSGDTHTRKAVHFLQQVGFRDRRDARCNAARFDPDVRVHTSYQQFQNDPAGDSLTGPLRRQRGELGDRGACRCTNHRLPVGLNPPSARLGARLSALRILPCTRMTKRRIFANKPFYRNGLYAGSGLVLKYYQHLLLYLIHAFII